MSYIYGDTRTGWHTSRCTICSSPQDICADRLYMLKRRVRRKIVRQQSQAEHTVNVGRAIALMKRGLRGEGFAGKSKE